MQIYLGLLVWPVRMDFRYEERKEEKEREKQAQSSLGFLFEKKQTDTGYFSGFNEVMQVIPS